jgi:hypothetical protein
LNGWSNWHKPSCTASQHKRRHRIESEKIEGSSDRPANFSSPIEKTHQNADGTLVAPLTWLMTTTSSIWVEGDAAMRSTKFFVILVALLLVSSSRNAVAQTLPQNSWTRGTTLELFAGGANAPPQNVGTFGAAVGWELNHALELQGIGIWLPEHQGSQAFAAEFKALVNVTGPARLVPYLAGGVGMYRATYDVNRASLPHFYEQRVGLRIDQAHFRDPSFVMGGGANVYIAKHLSIRPEVTLRLVTNGSDVYRVTMANISLAYHVEEHQIGN